MSDWVQRMNVEKQCHEFFAWFRAHEAGECDVRQLAMRFSEFIKAHPEERSITWPGAIGSLIWDCHEIISRSADPCRARQALDIERSLEDVLSHLKRQLQCHIDGVDLHDLDWCWFCDCLGPTVDEPEHWPCPITKRSICDFCCVYDMEPRRNECEERGCRRNEGEQTEK